MQHERWIHVGDPVADRSYRQQSQPSIPFSSGKKPTGVRVGDPDEGVSTLSSPMRAGAHNTLVCSLAHTRGDVNWVRTCPPDQSQNTPIVRCAETDFDLYLYRWDRANSAQGDAPREQLFVHKAFLQYPRRRDHYASSTTVQGISPTQPERAGCASIRSATGRIISRCALQG